MEKNLSKSCDCCLRYLKTNQQIYYCLKFNTFLYSFLFFNTEINILENLFLMIWPLSSY